MQKSSCAWDVAFEAVLVQRSHRCTCWPGESSPGNPLGSCLGYRFRNISGSFNILKLNLCCCSLHTGSPRNSASVENPNKPKLQESPVPRAETPVYLWRALWTQFHWCYISSPPPLCFSCSSLVFKCFLQQINYTGNTKEIPLNPKYML